VPVPAAPAAVRRRGFDHSADIARHLARLTDTPVQALLKAAASADQRSLGRSARFANREGAFRIAAGVRMPARIVLIDDVLTTGATLDGAARVLRRSGAEDVRALAVARSYRPVPDLEGIEESS
jgi:predicted amidophosphoribosyltransferase